jgi:hypothetical protein
MKKTILLSIFCTISLGLFGMELTNMSKDGLTCIYRCLTGKDLICLRFVCQKLYTNLSTPQNSELIAEQSKINSKYYKAVYEDDLKMLKKIRQSSEFAFCTNATLSEHIVCSRYAKATDVHDPIFTTLYWTCLHGNVQEFKYLLPACDLNSNVRQLIPLFFRVCDDKNSHQQMLEELLRCKFDFNAMIPGFGLPIDWLITEGVSNDCFSISAGFLLQSGAINPNMLVAEGTSTWTVPVILRRCIFSLMKEGVFEKPFKTLLSSTLRYFDQRMCAKVSDIKKYQGPQNVQERLVDKCEKLSNCYVRIIEQLVHIGANPLLRDQHPEQVVTGDDSYETLESCDHLSAEFKDRIRTIFDARSI